MFAKPKPLFFKASYPNFEACEFNRPKQIKTRLCILKATVEEIGMPTEITDVDKFVAMSAKAKYCSVQRLKDNVKLKLRTSRQLYTLKVEPLRVDEIIKKLQCEIHEKEK